MTRTHVDRCPGVLRPWIADDGALVRVRVPGGEVASTALAALFDVAERWGDGSVLLTSRANLQVRGLPSHRGAVPPEVVAAVERAGLLPSRTHERVRNVMASPLTGRIGGLADLRPVVRALDAAICGDAMLAGLPGRFLCVLDDGRGDVRDRPLDLGLVAVDGAYGQLRAGAVWGPTVPLADAAPALADLARAFAARRGRAWHVDELEVPLCAPHPRDARTYAIADPPPYGLMPQDDGRAARHLAVPDGLLTRALLAHIAAPTYVVTPWRSLLAVDLEETS